MLVEFVITQTSIQSLCKAKGRNSSWSHPTLSAGVLFILHCISNPPALLADSNPQNVGAFLTKRWFRNPGTTLKETIKYVVRLRSKIYLDSFWNYTYNKTLPECIVSYYTVEVYPFLISCRTTPYFKTFPRYLLS